jgi:cyclopropane-fatty-acyl-phospholipid synthase
MTSTQTPTRATPTPPSAAPKASAAHVWLMRRLLQSLGDAPVRVVLWDGTEVAVSAAEPAFRVYIRDRATLLGLARDPDLGFGDAFSEGRIEVEGDLGAFLELTYRVAPAPVVGGPIVQLLRSWLNRPRSNSRAGSRDNIHHHYNIGNDFYKLWLDDEMVYTCAYFPTPDATLEKAQRAKMDHVCRKLQLRPGQTVLEAGCGWGALARHMVRHYGVTVRAFNISHEQIVYARQRAKAEGLDGRVEYVEDDYRNIKGTCDAFASVGMLEHVGVAHYRELGGVIHRCLKPQGRTLVHTIGKSKPEPTNPWLERRIFPGSYMPSLGEMMGVFEPWNFSILDVENLRLHYAKTLEHWQRRFEASVDQVRKMFGEKFVRMWRLYLAGSWAGFTAGGVQLFQVVAARFGDNTVPWTRTHLYD